MRRSGRINGAPLTSDFSQLVKDVELSTLAELSAARRRALKAPRKKADVTTSAPDAVVAGPAPATSPATTTENAAQVLPFRFLDLPPELRILVLEYHLVKDIPLDITEAHSALPAISGLSAVSRQVRTQSLAISTRKTPSPSPSELTSTKRN